MGLNGSGLELGYRVVLGNLNPFNPSSLEVASRALGDLPYENSQPG